MHTFMKELREVRVSPPSLPIIVVPDVLSSLFSPRSSASVSTPAPRPPDCRASVFLSWTVRTFTSKPNLGVDMAAHQYSLLSLFAQSIVSSRRAESHRRDRRRQRPRQDQGTARRERWALFSLLTKEHTFHFYASDKTYCPRHLLPPTPFLSAPSFRRVVLFFCFWRCHQGKRYRA